MIITNFQKTIKQAVRAIEKGQIDLNYYIQRPDDQWNKEQKTLIIHSVIKNFPIPELFTIKELETNKVFALDGKQRLTVLREFVNDGFAIDEEHSNVVFEGKEIEVGGCLFSELSEELQEHIESYTLYFRQIEEAEEYEVNEMFYALNNGKPLTRVQKARSFMKKDWIQKIKETKEHPFMEELAYFTDKQRKNNDDENVLLQFMILERYKDEDMKNMSAFNVAEYGKNLQEDEMLNEKYLSELKETFNFLKLGYGDATDKIIMKKANLPYVLNVANRIRKQGNVHPQLLFKAFNAFKTAINGKAENLSGIETNYNDYAKKHTTDRANVIGKRTEMNKFIDEFIKQADEYKI